MFPPFRAGVEPDHEKTTLSLQGPACASSEGSTTSGFPFALKRFRSCSHAPMVKADEHQAQVEIRPVRRMALGAPCEKRETSTRAGSRARVINSRYLGRVSSQAPEFTDREGLRAFGTDHIKGNPAREEQSSYTDISRNPTGNADIYLSGLIPSGAWTSPPPTQGGGSRAHHALTSHPSST